MHTVGKLFPQAYNNTHKGRILMSKNRFLPILLGVGLLTVNCATGDAKLSWQQADAIDYDGAVSILVEKAGDVTIPEAEWQFMEADIKQKVSAVFKNTAPKKGYTVKIQITQYTEGSAFARFMLAGLGQMHFKASVEVSQVKPGQVVVRKGTLEKDYSMGGIMGGSATMHESINVKVGAAIAEAVATAIPAPGPS